MKATAFNSSNPNFLATALLANILAQQPITTHHISIPTNQNNPPTPQQLATSYAIQSIDALIASNPNPNDRLTLHPNGSYALILSANDFVERILGNYGHWHFQHPTLTLAKHPNIAYQLTLTQLQNTLILTLQDPSAPIPISLTLAPIP